MGRVFSFEELRNKEAPTDAQFEDARLVFDYETKRAIDDELVRGAMIFGSAAIKKTTIRSDIDCFIVLTSDDMPNWRAAANIVRGTLAASQYKIPIGAIARSAEKLQTGRHEMDRYFGAHLAGDYRIIVGEDPALHLAYRDEPGIDILQDFMVAKTRKLSQFAWQDEMKEMLQTLQRVLELPNAVGRKALRMLDEYEGTDSGIENSADKKLVGNASMRLFEELGTKQHAVLLAQADA
jgi:hypothetical protein